MKKKRYRSIYDAMDDALRRSVDTEGVKSAKECYKEQKTQQAQGKRFTTLEDVLSGKTEQDAARASKIRKLQAIIDDQGASQGEKDNAQRLLEKIKNKGVKE